MLSDMSLKNVWTRIKREHGLYRYNPSGQYFARVRFKGKLYRKKLKAGDLELAKRKLRTFKNDLARTDATKGNTSFAKVLDDYAATLTGAKTTLENKRAIVAKLKETFFGADSLPLRMVKPTAVAGWLSKHYGDKSASSHNQALTVCRDALDMAVNDEIIVESPAKGLKYRKPVKPIRPTPTFEQFQQIVADIRNQRFNADAEQSADFVQFLGLAGLGQAEASSLTRADVDLDAGRIIVYRHKTDVGFTIPIYPQLRPLVERLCKGKKPHERLFTVYGARKAIANACKRLGFVRELPDGRLVAQFTHRSLRRMFITRCLERGIDVQTVSRWQGHKDGGKLILQVYGDVGGIHSQRMAALLTDGEPENVIPITAEAR
jgi:integrase